MSERIDISEPLREICERLGLSYTFVRAMVFSPNELTAIVYLANEQGQKYLVEGEPAVETRVFRVTT